MDRTELIDFLNVLLEAERAGARGVGELARAASGHAVPALRDVAHDEARFCAMLAGHIERLGGKPSRKVGAFAAKLLSLPSFSAQLELLDRGQGWVAKRLEEALPTLDDEALRADLTEMLDVHRRNIARCAALPPGNA